MSDPDARTRFAGVDARTDAQLPRWYTRRRQVNDVISFADAIRSLPRAIDTTVAYQNPYSDEWIPAEEFTALVEPDRLRQQATDEDSPDPLFHIPTDSYAVINPTDIYGPLEEVLREETIDGQALGEIVFGEIRQYRGGGEIHMDILFDGLSVSLPDREDPITMGVTSGYDFFGGHAVYVEGFARDSYCANSIRQVTDRESIKHVGDVADFQGWWADILGQLGLVADDLLACIEAASEITVEFTDVPFDVVDFFELLAFPSYLAEQAASDARANATNPFEIDMWTLHSGATYALTHCFQGKEGSTLDRYVRTANDILFNPEATIDTVETAYEQRANAATEDGDQTDLETQATLAHLERVSDDIRAKATQFDERAASLRERFETADD